MFVKSNLVKAALFSAAQWMIDHHL